MASSIAQTTSTAASPNTDIAPSGDGTKKSGPSRYPIQPRSECEKVYATSDIAAQAIPDNAVSRVAQGGTLETAVTTSATAITIPATALSRNWAPMFATGMSLYPARYNEM